jgi:hypothetical protein
MFYREHGVTHIHAVYGECEISVEVETGRIHGHFPPRALKLVLEWMRLQTAGRATLLLGAAQSTSPLPSR